MKRPRPLSALFRVFESTEDDRKWQTIAQFVSALDDVEEVERAKYTADVASTAVSTIILSTAISVVHRYPGVDVDFSTDTNKLVQVVEGMAEAVLNMPSISVFVYGGLILAESIEIRRTATARIDQLQS